jgi:clusterin-associated protein 1
MSYRELRNFAEIMRALGYPRLISVENFRTPNFELVSDVLFWLVHRYEPTAELTDEISGNNGVEFLKTVAQIMYSKAHINLKIRRLFQADGFAVKELLKVGGLLYSAIHVDSTLEDQDDSLPSMSSMELVNKMEDLKKARTLAAEIVDGGAKVYTLLGSEVCRHVCVCVCECVCE